MFVLFRWKFNFIRGAWQAKNSSAMKPWKKSSKRKSNEKKNLCENESCMGRRKPKAITCNLSLVTFRARCGKILLWSQYFSNLEWMRRTHSEACLRHKKSIGFICHDLLAIFVIKGTNCDDFVRTEPLFVLIRKWTIFRRVLFYFSFSFATCNWADLCVCVREHERIWNFFRDSFVH